MNIQLDGRGGQAAPGLSSDGLRWLRIWQACWHRAVEAELISAGNSGRYRMIRSHTVPFWVFCSVFFSPHPLTLLTWIISHQQVCVKTQALIWSDETLPTPFSTLPLWCPGGNWGLCTTGVAMRTEGGTVNFYYPHVLLSSPDTAGMRWGGIPLMYRDNLIYPKARRSKLVLLVIQYQDLATWKPSAHICNCYLQHNSYCWLLFADGMYRRGSGQCWNTWHTRFQTVLPHSLSPLHCLCLSKLYGENTAALVVKTPHIAKATYLTESLLLRQSQKFLSFI